MFRDIVDLLTPRRFYDGELSIVGLTVPYDVED